MTRRSERQARTGIRLIAVRRKSVQVSHWLRVGHSKYPGDDDLGQADRALCGIWVGFAYGFGELIDEGEFARLAKGTEATCRRCRARRAERL